MRLTDPDYPNSVTQGDGAPTRIRSNAATRALKSASQPCAACPWTAKGQPDITPEVRAAAERGEWFCCHVHMGTCFGAQRYGESKQRTR